jgi:GT2 family glycosyltransferase
MPSDDLPTPPPTISIVIPTYNRPASLHNCLMAMSQLRYSRERFEVVIVDDGGLDDLAPLVHRNALALNIRLLRQSNTGPAGARNAGATAARHEYLAFTDDDCLVDPDWLRELAKPLQAHPNALIGGGSINALPRNRYAEASHTILEVVNDHFNSNHQRCTFFPSNNIAMPRRNYLEVGGFDPAFRWSEDRDLCDRWSAKGWPLVYAPAALISHARDMSLWGFCEQHFSYGRGAWLFHRARKARQSGDFEVEGSFYMKCFRRPFESRRKSQAVPAAVLMGIWQLANAAGFAYEAVRSRSPARSNASGGAGARRSPNSRDLPAA